MEANRVSYKVIILPIALHCTSKVGVESVVLLSVEEDHESEAACKSGRKVGVSGAQSAPPSVIIHESEDTIFAREALPKQYSDDPPEKVTPGKRT